MLEPTNYRLITAQELENYLSILSENGYQEKNFILKEKKMPIKRNAPSSDEPGYIVLIKYKVSKKERVYPLVPGSTWLEKFKNDLINGYFYE